MSIDLGFIGTLSQAKAQKAATQAQMRAIKEQRKFLFENLDPAVMQPAVLAADIERAKQQRALQEQMDPALAASRTLAQQNILDELSKNGVQAGKVADEATAEALAPGQAYEAKHALIAAALDHLKQGATLPPDVQAELVQAGLEQSGMATGRSSAQGIGGTMLRTILGQAGLNLQMQRQQKAEQLLASASNLEAQRQNVLNTLFPNLSLLQTQNMGRASGAFELSQSAMPAAGMSGTDVANIWLARVGAANQLTQQQGNVASANALAQGNIFSSAMGSAGVNLNQAIDIGKKIFSTPTTSGGDWGGYSGGISGGTGAADVPAEADWSAG